MSGPSWILQRMGRTEILGYLEFGGDLQLSITWEFGIIRGIQSKEIETT